MRTCPRCGTENPPEANFCLWCGAALRARIGAEERKIITVLFCDLQGFTAAAEQRDPEEVGATLRRYHAVTKELIEGHGGTVEKFLGDGVIGVFGMPVSHEDDPERAIRAALRIVDASAEATSGLGRPLPVRVGVTTGEALVSTVPGEQVGGSIAGDVVNTAARLQAAAPPNGILVAEATYRATAANFVYEPHEPIRAKGKTDPISVWRPLRARGRIGVDRDQPDTPFVGRARESAQLREAFTAAIETPAVTTVFVSGDAGIGKSRLVREFSTYIEELPTLVRWRRGRCLPYGEGVRFWAIAEIVKAEAGILDTDDPAAAADALHLAVEALDVEEAERGWLAQILAPLLGLPGPATAPSREELFGGIRRFLAAMASDRPTVLVLEDLQWADDAMLELLASVQEESTGLPLLLLGVTRIEIEDLHPGWLDAQTSAMRIALDVVGDEESRALIRALLADERLAPDAEDALVARAGGNPLFAEEFVRMLRDRGALGAASAADLPMPESLRALAVARLDALPADLKAVIHDASVLGRVFWPGAVAAVGEADPDEVEAHLPFLLRRRLIERRDPSSVEGEAELAFRHDITMRVAYDQIPRAARARKHRNAAAWVRRIGGGRVTEVAEEIAHHLEQSLALTPEEDPVLRAETADAQVLVASHLDALDAPGAVRAYERALDLLAPDAPTRSSVLVRAAAAAEAIGRFETADDWYREAIEAFEAADEPCQLGETMGLLGRSLLMQGRVQEADEVFHRAVAILDALPPGPELARVCARLAGRSFVAGDYDASIRWAARTLEVAGSDGPRDAVSMALQYRGSVRAERGEPEGLDDLREAIRIAREAELTDVLGVALGNLAYLTWFRDGPAAALEIAQEIEAFGAARGFAVLEMWGQAAEIESCFDLGEWDRVLELADEMIRWDAKHGPSQIGAFGRFGAAWVLIRRGRVDEAVAHLETVASEPAFSGLAEFRATIAAMGTTLAGDELTLAAHLEDFRTASAELPEVRVHLLPVVVRAAVGHGRADLAASLVPADPGPPVERRRLSHATAMAVLDEAEGAFEDAADALADLAEAWEAFGFPLEVGQCQLGRARCLHALGRDDDATAALREARERFRSLDAAPLLRETDDLAAALEGYAADSMAAS